MRQNSQAGFSIVELAIALVIAGLFIVSGFQLYGAMTSAAAESRWEASASNYAYGLLRDQSYATGFIQCSSGRAESSLSTSGIQLPGPVSVKLRRCQPDPTLDLLRVEVAIKYGTPAKEVVHATYLNNN